MSKSRKHAQLSEFWRRYRKNKTAVLGLVLLIIIIGTALFADLIVPYSKCIEQVGRTGCRARVWLTFSARMSLGGICLPG